MSWLRWKPGRQGGRYEKMLLLQSTLFNFDLYLLRFKEGCFVRKHRDVVNSGRHYRANLTLKAAEKGGRTVIFGDKTIRNTSRLQIFRPDVQHHLLTRIDRGSMYTLSLGWVR